MASNRPHEPGGDPATTSDPAGVPEPAMRRRPARARARRRRAVIAAVAAGALLLAAGIGAVVTLGGGEHDAAARSGAGTDLAGLATPVSETLADALAAVPEAAPEPEPEPEETEPDTDVDTPDSITVVVNKQRPLDPIDWEADDLVMPEGIANTNGQPMRAEAATALERMYAEASDAGLPFVITSAYRPYDMQVGLFDSYVERDGLEAAETYSARAGHSEHQTGLAADLDDGGGCAFMDCFGETPTGVWLRDNAYRFGFILRYNEGEEPVVGYIYEPWHFRYVGTDVSTAMHDEGELNLETFLGLDAAPDY